MEITPESPSLARLREAVRPFRERLLVHPLYGYLRDADALRVFMEHHVYAVWDFMSLLKALQRELTCVSVPWVPRGSAVSRRLINELVLGEESDELGDGVCCSHFELYLSAMGAAGADTVPIRTFLARVAGGDSVPAALEHAGAPHPAREFVDTTWRIVLSASPSTIAAAFLFGREEIIPDMFRAMVERLASSDPDRFELFRRYLERHIALDQGRHAPMARAMLLDLCANDPSRWSNASEAACTALAARAGLWDGILGALHSPTPRPGPSIAHSPSRTDSQGS